MIESIKLFFRNRPINSETGKPYSVLRIIIFYINMLIISPIFDGITNFIQNNFNKYFGIKCNLCSFYRGILFGYTPLCSILLHYFLRVLDRFSFINKLSNTWLMIKLKKVFLRCVKPILVFIYDFFVVESPIISGVRGIIVGCLIHLSIVMTTGFTIHNAILKFLHLPTLESMISLLLLKTLTMLNIYNIILILLVLILILTYKNIMGKTQNK